MALQHTGTYLWVMAKIVATRLIVASLSMPKHTEIVDECINSKYLFSDLPINFFQILPDKNIHFLSGFLP